MPIEIWTWTQLAAMAGNLSGIYVLMRDLLTTDADYAAIAGPAANGGLGWTPIGSNVSTFMGSLDGNGFTIDGLTISNTSQYNGLFGFILGGSVTNLKMTNFNMTSGKFLGAIVGVINGGSITKCFCDGVCFSSNTSCGVAIGECLTSSVTVSEVYTLGSSRATFYSGGVIGRVLVSAGATFSMTNCGSGAAPTSSSQSAGGLIGLASNADIIDYCYSFGAVTAGSAAGGLIGTSIGSTSSNCFWDTETSGQATSAGAEVGKTTAEMQTESTFTGAGWDFTTIWVMDDYPELQWAAGPTPPPSCAETPFNPLDKATNITLSNSDLTAATNAGNISWRYVRDTQGLTRAATGRQFEIEVDVIPSDHGIGVGLCNSSFVIDGVTTFLGTFGGASIGLISQVQTFIKAIYYNGSIVHTLTNYIAVGDKIGVSLYSDRVEFMLNDVLIHTETDTMSGVLYPTWGTQGNGLGQSTIHTLDTSIVFKDSGADQWAGPCSPAIVSDKSFTSSFVSGFLTSFIG